MQKKHLDDLLNNRDREDAAKNPNNSTGFATFAALSETGLAAE
jgi:hypothetical protein